MSPYVVCLTGASGVAYGVRLVEELLNAGKAVDLVISNPGWDVLGHELGFSRPDGEVEIVMRARLGLDAGDQRLRYYENDNLFAPICSGSYRTKGVVVIPAAMATVGAIANGVSLNLIERAADVALKEGRKLVVVPRETPLSIIHLENFTKLAKAGARIVPAMPGFYTKPANIDEIVDFVVGKVLDVLEIEHRLYKRWREE
ncbi:MAG: UbiX family flavin prenyltransferase [Actinobacteria bacterium]|nr:UbiX family flavin prenyltransferase [Actinomycetota bacterium]